jgi:hypothetical protein
MFSTGALKPPFSESTIAATGSGATLTTAGADGKGVVTGAGAGEAPLGDAAHLASDRITTTGRKFFT